MKRNIFEDASIILNQQTADFKKRKKSNASLRNSIRQSLSQKTTEFEKRKKSVQDELKFIRKK
ncbi:hypothetical protein CAY60_018165 [Shouchella clausii]|uniref:hypothetical protein n=1 Tax=Shouchella TaxID=2893057 RepID=UPI0005555DE1|nr:MULTISPECIES: hypothetical protein [Shouchella]MBU3231054.1 hypothetical protein [Shouchella clausii]MBU3262871.1 hypothetical protein [Shouchella clausii]MBU3505335.1 hypothetical protein [Shouchella clausii]MBU3534901.1 hypothetical protein [Shouchella clausii]MBX0310065.1 hypothetical protein [Shouchella clausii]